MGAWASELPASLAIEPGSEQSCWVQVRNTGEIVDEFVFEVLGDAASWAQLDKPTLSLLPGTEGELHVSFRPPRLASTPVGLIPFAIKIASKERPEDSIVKEGTLAVAPFSETAAELTPRTSHGRLVGRHELAFDNRGNLALDGGLVAADPDNRLRFSFRPATLAAAPGTATFAKLRARPRKRVYWGQPKTHPFTVQVQTDKQPLTVDGTMVQQALIPKWIIPALLALGALAALWAFALRPQIQSTARDAVKKDQQKLQVQVNQQGDATKGLVKGLQKALAGLPKGTGGNGPAKRPIVNVANTVSTAAVKGAPSGFRLQANCPPACAVSFTVPKGKTFSLTDIVLGNPQGDTGTLSLKRANDVLLVESLDNFRDLDFHFIAPIVASSGQALTLAVTCQNAARATAQQASSQGQTSAATTTTAVPCTAAAYLAGFTQAKSKKKG